MAHTTHPPLAHPSTLMWKIHQKRRKKGHNLNDEEREKKVILPMHQMQETSALWRGLLISECFHGYKQSSFTLSLDFILDSDNMKQNMRHTGGDILAKTGDHTRCLCALLVGVCPRANEKEKGSRCIEPHSSGWIPRRRALITDLTQRNSTKRCLDGRLPVRLCAPQTHFTQDRLHCPRCGAVH